MIGWLQGVVVDKQQPGKLVLNVNGVGYDVETSLTTFFQLESICGLVSLHVHTIVREDALLLYGFSDQNERALFRSLIKVNGVGPKMAMAILSSITPADFIACIQQANATMLTRLPGIGKKTAERLVVEMKDSLRQHPLTGTYAADNVINGSHQVRYQDEAIAALEALGYKQNEAVKMIHHLDDGQKTCEQLIRQALQCL